MSSRWGSSRRDDGQVVQVVAGVDAADDAAAVGGAVVEDPVITQAGNRCPVGGEAPGRDDGQVVQVVAGVDAADDAAAVGGAVVEDPVITQAGDRRPVGRERPLRNGSQVIQSVRGRKAADDAAAVGGAVVEDPAGADADDVRPVRIERPGLEHHEIMQVTAPVDVADHATAVVAARVDQPCRPRDDPGRLAGAEANLDVVACGREGELDARGCLIVPRQDERLAGTPHAAAAWLPVGCAEVSYHRHLTGAESPDQEPVTAHAAVVGLVDAGACAAPG